jgi:mono/diheme cytochrome c family protein
MNSKLIHRLGWRLGLTFAIAPLVFAGLADDKKARPEWIAPAKFKKIKNPVKADQASLTAGKKVYIKECMTCHGVTGVGDGKQAKDLEVAVGNLRTGIEKETDGELYYKISKGQKPMPEFIKTLKPKERWNVINYIRTLQDKTNGADSSKKTG